MKRIFAVFVVSAAIFFTEASGAKLQSQFFSSTSSSSFTSSSSSSKDGEKPKTTFTSSSNCDHADSDNGFSSKSTHIDKLSPTSDAFAVETDRNNNGMEKFDGNIVRAPGKVKQLEHNHQFPRMGRMKMPSIFANDPFFSKNF